MPRAAPALTAWIADPAARAATRARRRMLDEDWARETPLPALARALEGLVDADAETVAALIRPVLAEAGWFEAAIAGLARAVRADDFLEPPLAGLQSAVQTGLMLYKGPHAAIFASVGARDAIAAKRARPRSGAIVFPGQMGLMRVIRGGGAMLSLWEGGWRGGVLLPACAPAGTIALEDGALIAIDGRTTSFVVERAQSDMVLLQATIFAGSAPTTCEYDAVTRALLSTGAARDEASRVQMLATLLADLDAPDAAAFDRASRTAESFARWHAMRCWVATDLPAARPRLAEMAARDPDAELRDLAARTLALCPA